MYTFLDDVFLIVSMCITVCYTGFPTFDSDKSMLTKSEEIANRLNHDSMPAKIRAITQPIPDHPNRRFIRKVVLAVSLSQKIIAKMVGKK
jgi:hypothetical protein